ETNGDGNVLRQYVYSIDGVRLAMKAEGQTLFYHYNPRGDVIAMTDQNGQIVANYEYDAWGNVLKSDTKGIAAENPFGYAGYMYDKEIGMYYLIARYYNPEHGVFLSVDPDPGDEDDPVTQNGYTYGDNNPVMNVDPDGHWVWVAINAGFAAYDGYKAYKAGGNWKEVGWAVASNYVKPLKIAKKLGASIWNRGSFRTGTKQAVQQKWGKKCVYCGKPADSIDHIVPWKRLKSTFKNRVTTREKALNLYNRTINLAPACRSCNSKKKDLPVKKFLSKYKLTFKNRKKK
ncbi:RHS repeat-associated core domain-containing protein, partial [Bacillus zanthoxyli]